MLSVKCNCCGATDSDTGSNGAPFQTWSITVATSDAPLAEDLAGGVTSGRLRVPAATVQFCVGCRNDLTAGNFDGLAAKHGALVAVSSPPALAVVPPPPPAPAAPSTPPAPESVPTVDASSPTVS
jgi:hypothetical protein